MQNPSTDTKWKWIKHCLNLQGLNFNKLASLYNIDRTCFTVLKNKPFPKYERILAEILEVQPQIIWPSRYDRDGNPIRFSTRYQPHKFFIERASKKIKEDLK